MMITIRKPDQVESGHLTHIVIDRNLLEILQNGLYLEVSVKSKSGKTTHNILVSYVDIDEAMDSV